MSRSQGLAGLLLGGLLAACTATAPVPATETVYVTLPAADALERVDPASGTVLAHTLVGMLPHNLLPSRDDRKLYVALVGSQAVAELDAASGKVLRTFLTEPVPATRADGSQIAAHFSEDAFSHTTCFACHSGGAAGAQPAVVGSRPFGLALSADGGTLYAANIRSGNLSVIDLASGTLTRLVRLEPSGQAHEATSLARLGGTLFVSLLPTLPTLEPHPPAIIRRLDLSTLTPLSDTTTGRDAAVLLADETRKRVYLSNVETNTLSRFDAAGRVLDSLTVGNSPYGQALLPDGQHLLVANFYDGSVSLINLDTGEVRTEELELQGKHFANPTHIALAKGGKQAYLVSGTPKQGHLLIVDLATLRVERALPIGGLGFDLVAVNKSVHN